VLQKLKYELKNCKDELLSAELTIKTLTSEKMTLEQKLSVLEKRIAEEVT
jgi:predicted  nucleic acid-binding Zn-ribbon protein